MENEQTQGQEPEEQPQPEQQKPEEQPEQPQDSPPVEAPDTEPSPYPSNEEQEQQAAEQAEGREQLVRDHNERSGGADVAEGGVTAQREEHQERVSSQEPPVGENGE